MFVFYVFPHVIEDYSGQVTMEDSEPPGPTPAAAGGSRLFRRPLKKKSVLAA